MGYKLIVSQQAEEELEEIIAYICKKLKNKQAASDLLRKIGKKYQKILDNPNMYELSREHRLKMKGYHKVPVDNFVILYRVSVEKREIYVDGIFYSGQKYKNCL